jgi:TetR/AcrR family transcriptional regulator, ethionamide resistance regulator
MAVLDRGAQSGERRGEAEAAFLAGTERLLAEGSSFADLSVERIAAAAGRSRTAFYLYFRDKRDLLMRLTESVVSVLYAEAERWWSGEDGRRDLRAALTDILSTYRDHADLLRAVVEASTYDEQVGEFWRNLVGRFVTATEARLVEEGEDPGRAAGKAFALTWMVERSCYQQVAREAGRDDSELIDALVEIWERSVYGPGA